MHRANKVAYCAFIVIISFSVLSRADGSLPGLYSKHLAKLRAKQRLFCTIGDSDTKESVFGEELRLVNRLIPQYEAIIGKKGNTWSYNSLESMAAKMSDPKILVVFAKKKLLKNKAWRNTTLELIKSLDFLTHKRDDVYIDDIVTKKSRVAIDKKLRIDQIEREFYTIVLKNSEVSDLTIHRLRYLFSKHNPDNKILSRYRGGFKGRILSLLSFSSQAKSADALVDYDGPRALLDTIKQMIGVQFLPQDIEALILTALQSKTFLDQVAKFCFSSPDGFDFSCEMKNNILQAGEELGLKNEEITKLSILFDTYSQVRTQQLTNSQFATDSILKLFGGDKSTIRSVQSNELVNKIIASNGHIMGKDAHEQLIRQVRLARTKFRDQRAWGHNGFIVGSGVLTHGSWEEEGKQIPSKDLKSLFKATRTVGLMLGARGGIKKVTMDFSDIGEINLMTAEKILHIVDIAVNTSPENLDSFLKEPIQALDSFLDSKAQRIVFLRAQEFANELNMQTQKLWQEICSMDPVPGDAINL